MKTMKKIALLSFVILMSVMLNGNTLIDVCADGEEKRQANIETEENTTLKQNREKDWQNVIKTEQDNKNSGVLSLTAGMSRWILKTLAT